METGTSEPERSRVGKKKLLRWIATLLVVGVVGALFARSLVNNWEQVRAEDLAFDWLWVAATVVFALAVPVTGLVWARIVRALDHTVRISAPEAVAVQSLSWVLKYIPGQVGSVLNKILWAQKKGISRTLVLISFVYENVFLQLASIVPAVIVLFVSLGPSVFGANATYLVVPLFVLLPLCAVTYRRLFRWVVNFAGRRVLKRDVPDSYFLSSWQSVKSMVEFLLPRVINGLGFVLISVTVADIGAAEWLPFAAAYVLAGAVGILAILVPSGLGVREAIIVIVLTQYIPVPQAIIISLLSRVCSTIGDAVVALIYFGVRRMIPKEIRP